MNYPTSHPQGGTPSVKRGPHGQFQPKKTTESAQKSDHSRPATRKTATKQQSLSQYTADAVITGAVKAKFMADSKIPFSAISVETNEGLVKLSGYVDKPPQIVQAEKIAQSVKGVKAVKNQLHLKS